MSRVLIAGFCTLPGPDRAGVQLRHVVSALIRHHQIDVLVLRRGDQAYVERMGAARVLRVPVPDGSVRNQVEAYQRALRRQLEGAEYEIVHFRDGFAGEPILELQRQLEYATVFDATRAPMAEPRMYGHELRQELERAERKSVEKANLVLAPHDKARNALSEFIPADRIHVVPPGVDVDAFDWDEPPPSDAPPVILYLGALRAGRGIRVLIRSMIDITAMRADARLILAGRGAAPFMQSLETAVSDLGLSDSIDFVGEIDHADVPEAIAAATVCIAPSAAEHAPTPVALFPTKILEYLACRRAVVAPRRGTVTMMMRDGEHGLLFEPGQPDDLAEKVLTLIGNERMRRQLALTGYELVRRVYTASGTRRALRSAYKWLVAQPEWTSLFDDAADELPTAQVIPLATSEVTTSDSFDDKSKQDSVHTRIDVEVTRVEQNPLPPEPEDGIRDPAGELTRVDGQALPQDDWVVDESRARITSAPGDSTDPSVVTADAQKAVAGELDVPTPPPEILERDNVETVFTAMTPLLGGVDDDSKTDTKAAPPRAVDDDSKTDTKAAPPRAEDDTDGNSTPADESESDADKRASKAGATRRAEGKGARRAKAEVGENSITTVAQRSGQDKPAKSKSSASKGPPPVPSDARSPKRDS